MTQTQIAGVLVKTDGYRLTLIDKRNPCEPITFHGAALHELIEILSDLEDESGELRAGFRVPLAARMGLTVRLKAGEELIEPTPVNLSLTGVLVRVGPNESDHLSVGTILDVELRTKEDKLTATLTGTVKRQDGNRIGILFHESFQGDVLNPPRSLLRIFKAMEMAFVRQRTRNPDSAN